MDHQLLPRALFSGVMIATVLSFTGRALLAKDVSVRAKIGIGSVTFALALLIVYVATTVHWVPARDGYGVP